MNYVNTKLNFNLDVHISFSISTILMFYDFYQNHIILSPSRVIITRSRVNKPPFPLTTMGVRTAISRSKHLQWKSL